MSFDDVQRVLTFVAWLWLSLTTLRLGYFTTSCLLRMAGVAGVAGAFSYAAWAVTGGGDHASLDLVRLSATTFYLLLAPGIYARGSRAKAANVLAAALETHDGTHDGTECEKCDGGSG